MASQAWLESSLRRSASLGLEVLERASRRSVDWTSTGASQTSSTNDDDGTQVPVKRAHTELDEVFGNVADLMAQMTRQCKRFYEAGCCTEPTDTETTHVCRFHRQPAAGLTTPALSARKQAPKTPHNKDRVSAADEDFYIEVSPGTYAVTASMPEAHQQTQLVSVKAGESINLTFAL